jgi:hypothetical protein
VGVSGKSDDELKQEIKAIVDRGESLSIGEIGQMLSQPIGAQELMRVVKEMEAAGTIRFNFNVSMKF